MKGSKRKVLMTHGLDDLELARLELMGHKIIRIDDANGGALLREILEGKAAPAEAPLPQEKVVIFNGYSDDELKKGVTAIRTNFTVRPIIAAVTEYSFNWSFEYLLTEHLIKDRDWNLKNAKEYQENLQRENEAAMSRSGSEAVEPQEKEL